MTAEIKNTTLNTEITDAAAENVSGGGAWDAYSDEEYAKYGIKHLSMDDYVPDIYYLPGDPFTAVSYAEAKAYMEMVGAKKRKVSEQAIQGLHSVAGAFLKWKWLIGL